MSREEQYSGMGYMDQGAAIIASKLAEQLGTDTIDLGEGRFDMRRLTIIEKQQLGLVMYATIRSRTSRAWGTVLDVLANWGVSVGGRGRRDIIRMEGVSKGGTARVESEMIRPGWGARNLYDRDWERQERERLGIE